MEYLKMEYLKMESTEIATLFIIGNWDVDRISLHIPPRLSYYTAKENPGNRAVL